MTKKTYTVPNISQKDKQALFALRALASEERIKIIIMLKEKEMASGEFSKNLLLEQSTGSHHINLLKNAGLVKVRRVGRKRMYSIDHVGFKRISQYLNLLRL